MVYPHKKSDATNIKPELNSIMVFPDSVYINTNTGIKCSMSH